MRIKDELKRKGDQIAKDVEDLNRLKTRIDREYSHEVSSIAIRAAIEDLTKVERYIATQINEVEDADEKKLGDDSFL